MVGGLSGSSKTGTPSMIGYWQPWVQTSVSSRRDSPVRCRGHARFSVSQAFTRGCYYPRCRSGKELKPIPRIAKICTIVFRAVADVVQNIVLLLDRRASLQGAQVHGESIN